MATVFTHAIVGAALVVLAPAALPRVPLLFCAVLLAIIPDADVIAFRSGISYQDVLGHRGITHSILFSVLLALPFSLLFYRFVRIGSCAWLLLYLIFVLAGCSHGLLDAMTNAGLGVGFFIPLTEQRYFFSWRPLQASPVNISMFFSGNPVSIMYSEIKYIWLPTIAGLLFWFGVKRILHAKSD